MRPGAEAELRASGGRFEGFDVAELQQMIGAMRLEERWHLFKPGSGHLIPRLRDEAETALAAKLEDEEPTPIR